jgi:hypothetical protein
VFSAADVVEKIEWLKKHDKEAQQIVQNARNFGLSYLRLEDQYCYVATLLDTLGECVFLVFFDSFCCVSCLFLCFMLVFFLRVFYVSVC